VVRTAREPMLAQLKLAWWRDRLVADPAVWPKGEPLLARLAQWREPAGLGALVDGWESLLGEPPLGAGELAAFSEGRAAGLGALAAQLGAEASGVPEAGRSWAAAELLLERGDPGEQAAARSLLDETTGPGRLARELRPLVVLAGVTRRAAVGRGAADLYRPGAYFRAIRLGLLGR